MTYTFITYLQKFENNKVWSHHLKIPDEIAAPLREATQRVLCTLNNSYTFQCGLLSAGELGYFININQTIRKKLHLELNDTVEVQLQPDDSKYGISVPEVFAELLRQDPEFDRVFHKLTPGKQRSLLHLIGTFKSEVKQLEKLMILRNYLIQVQGKLDYKELHAAFKNGL